MMIWPQDYPPDCPCSDSSDVRGKVYRLVKHNPPSSDDFIPSPTPCQTDKYGDPECINRGISICNTYDGIIALRKDYKPFEKLRIAEGELTPEMGKMKRTFIHRKSHYTWWVPEKCDPSKVFVVIEHE